MPVNENVENLVEKLLEEELIKLMAEDYEDDDYEDDLDGGEEMVGGIDDRSPEDGLGLNKAKATVLAGEKVT